MSVQGDGRDARDGEQAVGQDHREDADGHRCRSCVADLRKEYDRVNTLLVELARRAARGRCGVHDEPLVLVWRCEEPANTNRAPRPVCPDCLEERVEELEAGIRAEVAAIPGHVVVREEGGDEDVLASLAVSVGKLKSGVVKGPQDLGETEVPPVEDGRLEADVFVGEVSKDARPDSWGWKLRLFRPGAVRSHAVVLSGWLFKGEREAIEDAEKVARETAVHVREVNTASCAGSSWMGPEEVGP